MTDDIQGEEVGPAMRVLDDRRRAFVRAVLDHPTAKGETLARKAGYSPKSGGYLRKQAHVLLHDERVLAAIEEETRKRVRFGGLIGIAGLIKMASDPTHKDHRLACESLADRGGFAATTKHEVKVDHTDRTGKAMIARIQELAAALGVDASRLLGSNAAREPGPMKVIEHDPEV